MKNTTNAITKYKREEFLKDFDSTKKNRKIIISADNDLYKEVALYCIDNGISMSNFIREMLKAKMKEHYIPRRKTYHFNSEKAKKHTNAVRKPFTILNGRIVENREVNENQGEFKF